MTTEIVFCYAVFFVCVFFFFFTFSETQKKFLYLQVHTCSAAFPWSCRKPAVFWPLELQPGASICCVNSARNSGVWCYLCDRAVRSGTRPLCLLLKSKHVFYPLGTQSCSPQPAFQNRSKGWSLNESLNHCSEAWTLNTFRCPCVFSSKSLFQNGHS